jgi:hypothetical protein
VDAQAGAGPLAGARQALCFHFRTSPDGPRQFGILPLRWDASDLPYCPVGPAGR